MSGGSVPNSDIDGAGLDAIAQAAGVAAHRLRAVLRAGEAEGGSPVAALTWLRAEVERLNAAYRDPSETVTAAEVRVLAVFAAFADSRGTCEMPRAKVTEAAGLASSDVANGLQWGRWRGTLSAHRVSEAGSPRIERVILRRWPRNGTQQPENGARTPRA